MDTRPPAWIFDLDGTLALRRGDRPGRRGPFDWRRVGEDDPNVPIIVLAQVLVDAGFGIVIASGRSDACRDQTDEWLARHAVPCNALLMRRDGDFTPDQVVKRAMYDHISRVWDIRGVFDDRDAVVAMWRDIGLTCLQVAPGEF